MKTIRKKPILNSVLLIFFVLFFAACGKKETAMIPRPQNTFAYMPENCYQKQDSAKNSCYLCHTNAEEPNYVNDLGLQSGSAMLADVRADNFWKNLWQQKASGKPDPSSNYLDAKGSIVVVKSLLKKKSSWDLNKNGKWDGYLPDIYFNADKEGFDLSPKGEHTGWRAYRYSATPFYWPGNGNWGEIYIRLPEVFRQDANGKENETVYKINLAIAEAMIKRMDIPLEEEIDETQTGVDLDKNGSLGKASYIKFDWAPVIKKHMYFAGKAGDEQKAGKVTVAAGLFPQGTEFLQVLYYPNPDGGKMARIKELQYMRKLRYMNYNDLRNVQQIQNQDYRDHSDRAREYKGAPEFGLLNQKGWVLQAFIEDKDGNLRAQTNEELLSCVGCHGNVGANTDSTFSFARKYSNADGGWKAWTPENRFEFSESEQKNISLFLKQNGNPDYWHRRKPTQNIAEAVRGNPEEISKLNALYQRIVNEQDYIYGKIAGVSKEVVRENFQ